MLSRLSMASSSKIVLRHYGRFFWPNEPVRPRSASLKDRVLTRPFFEITLMTVTVSGAKSAPGSRDPHGKFW